MNEIKKFLKKISEKLGTDKKSTVVIIAGIAGVILLAVSELLPMNSPKSEADKKEPTEISCSDYEKDVETRLQSIISQIDGAGSVSVMVTIDSTAENVYAQKRKENSGENRSSEDEYMVVKTDSGEGGILLRTAQPQIRGVAVVCTGAGSAVVRQNITNTVTAVLGISSARVSVTAMKRSNGG